MRLCESLLNIIDALKYSIDLPNSQGSESVDTLDLPAIFKALADHGKEEFRRSHFEQIKITGLNDEDIDREVHGGLKQFIRAEVSLGDQSYYFVDGKWFELTLEFQRDIDEMVNKVMQQCSNTTFSLPPWRRGTGAITEPAYISEICRDKNLVNMHNKHIQLHSGQSKAELCDIVSLKEKLSFIFIKRGTNSALRELFAQARMSIELFTKDLEFKKSAIDKVYKNQRSKNGHKSTFDRFSVVLAIKDHLLNRKPKPLANKLTTLAKLDLVHCVKFLKEQLGIQSVILYEIESEKLSETISIGQSRHSPISSYKRLH